MRLLLYCTKARKKYRMNNFIYTSDNLTLDPDTNKYKYGESFYLMCSKNGYSNDNFLNGKIVAECDCELVEEIKYIQELDDEYYFINKITPSLFYEKTCLKDSELFNYFNDKQLNNNYVQGFALYLSNVMALDKPKKLRDYYKEKPLSYDKYLCAIKLSTKLNIPDVVSYELLLDLYRLKRAPQNMCYVYDENGEKCILLSIYPKYLCKILNGEKTIEVRRKILNKLKELIK